MFDLAENGNFRIMFDIMLQKKFVKDDNNNNTIL